MGEILKKNYNLYIFNSNTKKNNYLPLSASTELGPLYLYPKIKSIHKCKLLDTYSLSKASLFIFKNSLALLAHLGIFTS